MTQASRATRAGPAGPEEQGGVDATAVDSTVLMNGRRELLIRHGEETYRLRVTASNKLILTK
jgi:hemin uptake protein HemP